MQIHAQHPSYRIVAAACIFSLASQGLAQQRDVSTIGSRPAAASGVSSRLSALVANGGSEQSERSGAYRGLRTRLVAQRQPILQLNPQVPEPDDGVQPGALPLEPGSASDRSVQELDRLRDQPSSELPAERALAPVQSGRLDIPVNVVDLSLERIGTGLLPESAAAGRREPGAPVMGSFSRPVAFKCVYWRSSQICHFPLYFEDRMLERHGHVRFGCMQPLVSGAKFLGTLPLLPYRHTLQPCHQPVYALGDWRPGSCAPPLRDQLPWDRQAAVVESLSLAGFFWAMPL